MHTVADVNIMCLVLESGIFELFVAFNELPEQHIELIAT